MEKLVYTAQLSPKTFNTVNPARVVVGLRGITLYTERMLHTFPPAGSVEMLALHCQQQNVLFQMTPAFKASQLTIELPPMQGCELMPANVETVKRGRHETLYHIAGWDRAAFDARFEEICQEFPPFAYSTAFTTTKDGWKISRGNSAD